MPDTVAVVGAGAAAEVVAVPGAGAALLALAVAVARGPCVVVLLAPLVLPVLVPSALVPRHSARSMSKLMLYALSAVSASEARRAMAEGSAALATHACTHSAPSITQGAYWTPVPVPSRSHTPLLACAHTPLAHMPYRAEAGSRHGLPSGLVASPLQQLLSRAAPARGKER